jgi:DNA-binding FadR family transcriptional regulator
MATESVERWTMPAVPDECATAPSKLTLEQAHRLMQAHRHFPSSSCRVRTAALRLLVAAGHYKLAPPPAGRIAALRKRGPVRPSAEPGRRTGLIGQITEQLRYDIQSGHWPIGGRIPTEAELTAATGLGRNTIREAVQSLVHAGMLERRPGAGTFVVATSAVAVPLSRYFADAREPDIAELRCTLDMSAAFLAACRRDGGDIAELTRLAVHRRKVWDVDPLRAADADIALHRALINASHNVIYREFADCLGLVWGAVPWCRARVTENPLHAEHDDLVRAVIDADPDAAAAAAERLTDEQSVPTSGHGYPAAG